LEQMPGYEKLKDGRTSVRLPKEERTPATPPTSMKVSLPMAAVTSGSKAAEAETKRDEGLTAATVAAAAGAADQHRSEKKKKKKDKKEKKEKRDKDKKDEKRHKHKHKDKDRDKEGSSSNRGASATPGSTASNSPAAATATPSSGLKLKVKLTPGGGEGQGQSHVAPLRLSIGEKTDSGSSKKRKPSEASGGPASKMSRVLGTPLELENGYVRDKGIGGGGGSKK